MTFGGWRRGARSAIEQLVVNYARCADDRRGRDLAALFTEGGELEIVRAGRSDVPEVHRGRVAIVDAIGALDVFRDTLHHVAAPWVEVESRRRARARTSCLAYHHSVRDGAQELLLMGISYDDVLVRSAGEWKFERRALHVLWVDRRALGAARADSSRDARGTD
ncbi:nuclear transport factor 2 family protein [Salinibacterium sp. ZJ70]|uniref:nuclear transport factor 2 family protein n=1 Tax=Salinibacterium sp. ZJ70 TaxID=2708084 RepID=UPI001CD72775|nr:nuclear transport factor 2 family protein [Salinibacterium sp. ZJ70]